MVRNSRHNLASANMGPSSTQKVLHIRFYFIAWLNYFLDYHNMVASHRFCLRLPPNFAAWPGMKVTSPWCTCIAVSLRKVIMLFHTPTSDNNALAAPYCVFPCTSLRLDLPGTQQTCLHAVCSLSTTWSSILLDICYHSSNLTRPCPLSRHPHIPSAQ